MCQLHSSSGTPSGHRKGVALSVRLSLAGAVAFLLAAIPPVGLAQASREPTAEQETAFKLTLERCYLCHYLDRTEVKFAPSLKDIYKRPSRTFANGKPINDQTMVELISEGSDKMPAFKYTLTPQQIQLIVKFLREGWAANVPMLRNSR